jgi:hypothetical protein
VTADAERPSPPAAESPTVPTQGARFIFLFVLVVCSVILVWSGAGKLRSPEDARLFVAAIFPSVTPVVAAGIVTAASIFELFLAAWLSAGLLTPRSRPRTALATFAVLMLAMAALLALAMSRGFEGSCGCFGSGGAGASTAVLRTACLAIVAGMGIVYAPRARKSRG